MDKDTIEQVLAPVVVVLAIATVLIYISGLIFGPGPEFLASIHEWLNQPLSEVKTGSLLIAIFFIVRLAQK